VEEVNIFKAWPTAKASKGCGLVVMATLEGAQRAISELHQTITFEGAEGPMVVEHCDPARLGVKAASAAAAKAERKAAAAAAEAARCANQGLLAMGRLPGGGGVRVLRAMMSPTDRLLHHHSVSAPSHPDHLLYHPVQFHNPQLQPMQLHHPVQPLQQQQQAQRQYVSLNQPGLGAVPPGLYSSAVQAAAPSTQSEPLYYIPSFDGPNTNVVNPGAAAVAAAATNHSIESLWPVSNSSGGSNVQQCAPAAAQAPAGRQIIVLGEPPRDVMAGVGSGGYATAAATANMWEGGDMGGAVAASPHNNQHALAVMMMQQQQQQQHAAAQAQARYSRAGGDDSGALPVAAGGSGPQVVIPLSDADLNLMGPHAPTLELLSGTKLAIDFGTASVLAASPDGTALGAVQQLYGHRVPVAVVQQLLLQGGLVANGGPQQYRLIVTGSPPALQSAATLFTRLLGTGGF